MLTKTHRVGGQARSSEIDLITNVFRSLFHTKTELVTGYNGQREVMLAMERGEVDIVSAYGLPGMLVSHPGWIDKGEASIIYQAALKRHRLLPTVPTLPELAVSDEGRAILRAISSTAEIGRSIIAGPGVPAERLAALRAAFAAMLSDPDFVAACDQRHFMVDPGAGEDMDTLVRETFQLSDAVRARTGELLNAN